VHFTLGKQRGGNQDFDSRGPVIDGDDNVLL